MQNNIVVIGAQWGDEGKGKVVDWLCERADAVVRFQGGHNAGHTLVIDDKIYKLSLLPSGVVRPEKKSLIGSGVVIDPWALQSEISKVKAQGVAISPDNLNIAENATLILPIYPAVDLAMENARGKGKIGTTGRGIGPAYEDKIGRRAIRVCDLADKDVLENKIDNLLEYHNRILSALGAEQFDKKDLLEKLLEIADFVLPYLVCGWKLLEKWQEEGKKILFEGAQGTMLDVEHGTYPFVTSSNTISAAAGLGSPIPLANIDCILGIVKAYTTRVGEGPFPTEQDNVIGQHLGEKGKEFGTVTGRSRRCGWLDGVLLRQACVISGITDIVLTKIDVLDELEEINICTKYEWQGKEYDYLPAILKAQQEVKPIYETMKGWQKSTYGIRNWDELPENTKKYINRIEEISGCKISLISTGPERDDMIIRQE